MVNQSGTDNAYRVDTTFDDHGGRTISSTLDFVSTFNSDQTFIMSTDFNVNSFATDGSNRSTTIGFGALGSSANFSSGAYFLTDFFWDALSSVDTGKVRIVEFDSSQNGAVLATSSSAISIDSNDNYRLTLKSIVDGGQLELTMTAENLTEDESASVTANGSVLTGGHFGYRNAFAESGAALNAEFDNFSVAIPEPATPSTPAATVSATTRTAR